MKTKPTYTPHCLADFIEKRTTYARGHKTEKNGQQTKKSGRQGRLEHLHAQFILALLKLKLSLPVVYP